jgi:hypothetical protein
MRFPFCVIDKKIDFRHTTGAYCVAGGCVRVGGGAANELRMRCYLGLIFF